MVKVKEQLPESVLQISASKQLTMHQRAPKALKLLGPYGRPQIPPIWVGAHNYKCTCSPPCHVPCQRADIKISTDFPTLKLASLVQWYNLKTLVNFSYCTFKSNTWPAICFHRQSHASSEVKYDKFQAWRFQNFRNFPSYFKRAYNFKEWDFFLISLEIEACDCLHIVHAEGKI